MSKYVLDCNTACTLLPYTEPAYTEHGFSTATIAWTYVVIVLVLAILVGGIAAMRIKHHEEKGRTDRMRIEYPPKICPTCGDKVR